MPPDGYPAFQYLQSVGVSNVNASGLARPISSGEQGLSCFGAGQGESADFRKLEEGCGPCLPTGVLIRGLGTGAAKLAEVRRKELFDLRLVLLGPGRFAMFPLVLGEACGRQVFALLDQSRVHARDLLEGFDRSALPIRIKQPRARRQAGQGPVLDPPAAALQRRLARARRSAPGRAVRLDQLGGRRPGRAPARARPAAPGPGPCHRARHHRGTGIQRRATDRPTVPEFRHSSWVPAELNLTGVSAA